MTPPNKFESLLRRNKETVGISALVFGITGLLFSYWSLRNQHADEIKNTIRFYLEEKDSDLTTVRVVTEYAQSLSGYVIETAGKDNGKLKRSSEASALYRGNPTSLRDQYVGAFARFELNTASVDSMRSVLNHLLRQEPQGASATPQTKDPEALRRKHGDEIVAPQLRAKANSFDPTERSAALILSAHLMHPQPPALLVQLDNTFLVQAFSRSFLGYLDYDKTDLNLSEFNLDESDFFEAVFANADFSKTLLDKTKFERVVFNGTTRWVSANLGREQKDVTGPDFRGALFVKDADFSHSIFSSVNFSTAAADEKTKRAEKKTVFSAAAVFVDTKLQGANFSDTQFAKSPNAKQLWNNFAEAKLAGVKFDGAKLPSISFRKSAVASTGEQSGVDFNKTEFQAEGEFVECDLPWVKFVGASAEHLTISGAATGSMANFSFANFNGFQVVGNDSEPLTFRRVNLSGAKFGYPSAVTPPPKLDKALFENCSLNHTRFDSASLADASFKNCEGEGAVFGPSTPKLKGGKYTNGTVLVHFSDSSALSQGVILDNVFISDSIAKAGASANYVGTNVVISKGEGQTFVAMVVSSDKDGLTIKGVANGARSLDRWDYTYGVSIEDNAFGKLWPRKNEFGLAPLIEKAVKAAEEAVKANPKDEAAQSILKDDKGKLKAALLLHDPPIKWGW